MGDCSREFNKETVLRLTRDSEASRPTTLWLEGAKEGRDDQIAVKSCNPMGRNEDVANSWLGLEGNERTNIISLLLFLLPLDFLFCFSLITPSGSQRERMVNVINRN